MSDMSLAPLADPSHPHEKMANALAATGWGLFENLLPAELADRLSAQARTIKDYQPAGIGRQLDNQLNSMVRRDKTHWIEGDNDAEQAWLAWTNDLRIYLNRTLTLGLDSFESHFAHYPPGSFYKRHLDAFQGQNNRVVSIVAYLNTNWHSTYGGELVLYDTSFSELARHQPLLGSVAIYFSETFPHEVLLTHNDRYSLAGWFRCRADLPLASL